MTTDREDPDSLAQSKADAVRELANAVSAAVRDNKAVSNGLLRLLVVTRSVSSSLDVMMQLPAALDRLTGLISDTTGFLLPEIVRGADVHRANVRRFLLEPQETYSLSELANLWRITLDDVRGIYHDELLALPHSIEPDALRIAWADAVGTSVGLGLLRPFDVEVALAGDFSRVRSDRWRTIPILVHLPRFIAERLAVASAPVQSKASLATHVEQFILELFQAEYRTAFFGNETDEGKSRP